jgi:hypothetical protein
MNQFRLATLATILLLCPACSDRTTAALVNGEGLLAEGSRFGVSVGDPFSTASTTLLKQGFQVGTIDPGGNCLSPKNFPAERTAYFLDLSWRQGTVCLGITKGRVSQIGRLYNPLST